MALLLRDAGMEVIYTGIRTSVDAIVQAMQEDVHIIGLSVLSGAHVGLAQQILACLHDKGLEDMKVVMGGVIPIEDAALLKALGIAAVSPAARRCGDHCRDTGVSAGTIGVSTGMYGAYLLQITDRR